MAWFGDKVQVTMMKTNASERRVMKKEEWTCVCGFFKGDVQTTGLKYEVEMIVEERWQCVCEGEGKSAGTKLDVHDIFRFRNHGRYIFELVCLNTSHSDAASQRL